MAKKKSQKEKVDSKVKDSNGDIKGIIYILIGILLSIAIYTSLAGALSILSRKIIYKLIGISAYAMPLYLIYFGYTTISSKKDIKTSRRIFGITLIIITLTLIASTASINILKETSGFKVAWDNISERNGIHGGFVGHIISYPLSKLLGFMGSYVLYLAIWLIGSLIMFDITVNDILMYFKEKKKLKKVNNNTSKTIKEKDLKVVKGIDTNNSLVKGEEDEFINGINNKIKILDFMKNSNLSDEKSANENKIDTFNIELFDDKDYEKEEDYKSEEKNKNETTLENNKGNNNESKKVKEVSTSHKKEKLTDEVKEVINKEIEGILEDKKEDKAIYKHPSVDLLKINTKMKLKSEDKKELIENASKLEGILNDFGVDAKVSQVTKGPSVTRFEIQPSPGVKVSKIVNLQDDIALGLAASGVRMEAPIPGKAAIGIEVPNNKQTAVFLREVLDSKEFRTSDKKLAFALGKDIAGKCVVGDLSTMPHMLIAGATGSGKSVCINTLIVSLLYKYTPDEVRLLMVDPKVVELSVYNGIPHLLIPVVTDPKKAAGALNWAVNEMNKRYKMFAESSVRNIEGYNALMDKGIIKEKLPYIVIIVDELADLMMACPNDVEDYICRLAQMARAAGMHLIIATQRPSVDVITGIIKANIPSRISFAVSSGIDSRTILDQTGAEKLLGRGDMLYNPIGENKPLRVQGSFISEEEVEDVVKYIKEDEDSVAYEEAIIEHIEKGVAETNKSSDDKDKDNDDLVDEAIKIVVEYNQASTSFLQRKLRIGFNRASRIMEDLEGMGIISERDGSKPRQILLTKDELDKI